MDSPGPLPRLTTVRPLVGGLWSCLTGLAVGFSIACGASSTLTSTPTAETTTWRGAQVTGEASAVTALEAAWQRTPGDWEPRGWTIMFSRDARIHCTGGGAIWTGCTSSRRVIEFSAEADADDLRWELGNARCFDRLGRRGLGPDYGWFCPA